MKISDFIFRFPVANFAKHDGICRVRIFIDEKQQIYAVFTDLGEKNPTSEITHSIENIRQHLIKKGFIEENVVIIEHYDRGDFQGRSFDVVTFDDNNSPSWAKTKIAAILAMLQCEPDEFDTHSLEIKYLFDEIERVRHEISPYLGEPWPEDYDVINRREEIKSNMLPHGALKTAIENGASEKELQNLIKSDLSILGDFYGGRLEAYICFSEFPIDDGFVDFVVFSGSSRMDVTLIEIKGANYNLINENNYEDFSAKTNQAVQQIRKRLGYITRNYEPFRKFVHHIRDEAEQGHSKFSAFRGPKKKLGVDPNKDIVLHTVVIGGRSKDDLRESQLRHDWEMRQSPSIKIDSWDSWIKRSKRK